MLFEIKIISRDLLHAGGNALSKIFLANQPKSHGPFVDTALYTFYMYGRIRSPFRLRDSGAMFLASFMLYTNLLR